MPNSDENLLYEPKHAPTWLAWGPALLISCAIAGSWLYVQAQHSDAQSHSHPRPSSIEAVRKEVQRGTDPHARRVDLSPRQTTIAFLREFQRPTALNADRHEFAEARIAPFETQVWTFKARVIQINRRSDGDLYLVVESNGHSGCVELPDPAHCVGSPFYSKIKKLRTALESEFQLSMKPVPVNRDARLTGVGFFGTGGTRDNGARLHPLLAIEWLDGQ